MKTIIIHDGTGDNEIEMTVQVTEEEYDKMEQIRRFSPSAWDGKELDLLQEARKLLRETNAESAQSKEKNDVITKDENATPTNLNEQPSKSNKRAWWLLAILGILFVGYLIIHSIIGRKTEEAREVILHSSISKTTETVNYQGLTFDYPSNWVFETKKISENIFLISGSNENGSEYIIILAKNTPNMEEDFINNMVFEYVNSEEVMDAKHSAPYNSTYHGIRAITSDLSYKNVEGPAYAKITSFTLYNSTFAIIQSAKVKSDLFGEDFQTMESSMKYTNSD